MYKNGFTKRKIMNVIKKNNQGYQASSRGACMYRTDTEDVNCCIVGCFIPDNKYSEKMEDHDADSVITDYNLEQFMPLSTELMEKLQRFHDEDLYGLTGKEFYDTIEERLTEMKRDNK